MERILPRKRQRSAQFYYDMFTNTLDQKSFGDLTASLKKINQVMRIADEEYIKEKQMHGRSHLENRLRNATTSLRCLFEDPFILVKDFPNPLEKFVCDKNLSVSYKEISDYIFENLASEALVDIFISRLPKKQEILLFPINSFLELIENNPSQEEINTLLSYECIILPIVRSGKAIIAQISNIHKVIEYFAPNTQKDVEKVMQHLQEVFPSYIIKPQLYQNIPLDLSSMIELIQLLFSNSSIEMHTFGTIESKRKTLEILISHVSS